MQHQQKQCWWPVKSEFDLGVRVGKEKEWEWGRGKVDGLSCGHRFLRLRGQVHDDALLWSMTWLWWRYNLPSTEIFYSFCHFGLDKHSVCETMPCGLQESAGVTDLVVLSVLLIIKMSSVKCKYTESELRAVSVSEWRSVSEEKCTADYM